MTAKWTDNRGKPLPDDHPLKGTNVIIGDPGGFDPKAMLTQAPGTEAAVEPTAEVQKPPSKLARLYAYADRFVSVFLIISIYFYLIIQIISLGTGYVFLFLLLPLSFFIVYGAIIMNKNRIRSSASTLSYIWDRQDKYPAWFILKAIMLAYIVLLISRS